MISPGVYIPIFAGMIWAIIQGLVTLYVRSVDRRVRANEERVVANREELIRLTGKLWSEEKLTRTIQEAVKVAFLDWENGFLKNYKIDKKETK